MDLKDFRALMTAHSDPEQDDSRVVDCDVILDKSLLGDLQSAIMAKIEASNQGRGTMAEGGADTTDLDAKIAEVQKQVDAVTVKFRFVAKSEPEYREITRRHPNANPQHPAEQDDFLADLADESLIAVIGPDGEPITGFDRMAPGEWRKDLLPHEFDQIANIVWSLNKDPMPLRPKS